MLTDTQREQSVQQGMQQLASENLVEAKSATIPAEGQPRNTQSVDLNHDVTPSEESLRIAVKCQTLESLEHLWQDYRSGHLNRVAEELLVTDDIKRRFDIESIELKTTISEADYLACKEYLSNRPGKTTRSVLRNLNLVKRIPLGVADVCERKMMNFDYVLSIVRRQCG